MALLAAIIHLASEQALPPWLGRAAQAWLLEAVRRVDPALADHLHSGQTRRPYTVSAPRGVESDYWLRITSVSPGLTAVLTDSVLPNLNGTIRLAGTEVSVKQVDTDGHPWAGRSDFEVLARQSFDTEPRRYRIEFATPTAFHRDGLIVPLPLPLLVYGSLIHAWNLFSPLPLPVPLLEFVERHVGIARHRIATRMVQFGDSEQHIGFTGTSSFILLRPERTGLSADEYRQRAQLLNLLTRFAFYTGVGVRTAVGMGQVRPY
jgi:CRISPR-associated endoribonuclease Cas6